MITWCIGFLWLLKSGGSKNSFICESLCHQHLIISEPSPTSERKSKPASRLRVKMEINKLIFVLLIITTAAIFAVAAPEMTKEGDSGTGDTKQVWFPFNVP